MLPNDRLYFDTIPSRADDDFLRPRASDANRSSSLARRVGRVKAAAQRLFTTARCRRRSNQWARPV